VEDTHGMYIALTTHVDADTGNVAAEIHAGKKMTDLMRQLEGTGIIVSDHRHATAVIRLEATGTTWKIKIHF